MKTLKLIACIAGVGLLAACGQGQDAAKTEAPAAEAPAATAGDPASVIKARQDNLKKFGAANRAMADELKKPAPDAAVFKTNADTIAALAPDLINWFPAGTGVESGVKTAAKAEIWAQPDDFKARHARLVEETAKFQATVASGDMAAITAGVEELGAACRNCHQVYRQRD